MIHLKTIKIGKPSPDKTAIFPFNIPAIVTTREVSLTTPVTFLVGENGSGKSTFLEAVAYAANMITVGSENIDKDETLSAATELANRFRLIWQMKIHKGFFLRAEDFFGYIKRLTRIKADLEEELHKIEKDYADRSNFAKNQARMAYTRELREMQQQYSRNLNHYSHGESFLELFQSRFIPGGLYLLDEPEVPLSPFRQLTLISMLKQMVNQDSQFIIATHSPILMAFPGATIISFDEKPMKPVAYQTVEHVVVTKSFLNDPEQYLRHL